MNEDEFERFMKSVGDEIKKKGGTYILNPASVHKANEIVKRLNTIKAKDSDNESGIKISMNVSDMIGYYATICFSFDDLFIDKKDFKTFTEILDLCDDFNITPGENERIVVNFTITDYIIKLK